MVVNRVLLVNLFGHMGNLIVRLSVAVLVNVDVDKSTEIVSGFVAVLDDRAEKIHGIDFNRFFNSSNDLNLV